MDALDRTIHRMLRRRDAGPLIRSYGVTAFTRKVRWYIWAGGRYAPERMHQGETAPINGLMAEALATAFY